VSHDVTQPGDQAYLDLDEDLFDFAAVAREADASEPEEDIEEMLASFRAGPAEELLAVPTAFATEHALPAAAHAPHALAGAPDPEPIAPPRSTAPTRPASARRPSAPEPELAPVARSSPLSKSVLAIALSVTTLNAAMAVVVLRGRASPGDVRPPERHEEVEPAERGTLAAPPHVVKTALPDPEAVDPAHAHPALDEARSEISRGEYSAARQRVYGLLAIIDRLEDPRRGALEADCQFLIAQSLHLEALARMGGAQ